MLPGHLTTKQITILACITVFGTIFFTLPRTLVQASGHSGWMSILLGSLLAVPLAWLITAVGSSMQEKSLIAYSLHVFGPVLGRLFALLILLPLLLYSAMTVRIITELLVTLILPETPLELIITMLLILRYYLARGGIRAIAQWSEVILPGAIVMIIALFTLSLNNVELQRIEPFFSTSARDIMKGSLGVVSLFAELSLLLFVYPRIKHKPQMFKTMLWSILILTLLFEATFLTTLGTYGSAYTQRLTFPVVEMMKDINIVEIIEHMESPFLAMWLFINLTKGTLTFHAACVGFQDWFGTTGYRELMIPLSVIIFYFAMLPDNIYYAIVKYEIAKGFTFWLYALVILIVLWLAGKLKSRRIAQ